MESIKQSSLKEKSTVIAELKDLLKLVTNGKEVYQSAAEATKSPDLKTLFLRLSGERIVYAEELKEHIALHEGIPENEDSALSESIHRAWAAIKNAFISNDDKSMLIEITKGERALIEKYDILIADYPDHADHLKLLKEQKDGITAALSEIEKEIIQF